MARSCPIQKLQAADAGRYCRTPRHAFAATVGGLNVRDVKNGELLWRSPGFAPRGCVNPAIANGRVYWPSAASGMIFCWEPEPSGQRRPWRSDRFAICTTSAAWKPR